MADCAWIFYTEESCVDISSWSSGNAPNCTAFTGSAYLAAFFSSLITTTFFWFSIFCCFLSRINIPIFICFSIRFFAYEKLPTNFYRSIFLSSLTLFCYTTFARFSVLSLFCSSTYLSASSYRRSRSSLFKFKNILRFLSSSLPCSFLIMRFISRCLVISYRFVSCLSRTSCCAICIMSCFSIRNSWASWVFSNWRCSLSSYMCCSLRRRASHKVMRGISSEAGTDLRVYCAESSAECRCVSCANLDWVMTICPSYCAWKLEISRSKTRSSCKSLTDIFRNFSLTSTDLNLVLAWRAAASLSVRITP